MKIIEGNVNLNDLYLAELPEFLRGVEVRGNFECRNNKLTSLKNCPSRVTGRFFCNYNRLESLEGAPEFVGRDFWCNHNQLTTLEGLPLMSESQGVYCHYNRLVSIKGLPPRVWSLWIYGNRLTTLDGLPKVIDEELDCSMNPVRFKAAVIRKTCKIGGRCIT